MAEATGVKQTQHLTDLHSDHPTPHLILSFSRLDIDRAQLCILMMFTFLLRALTIRASVCKKLSGALCLLLAAGIRLECEEEEVCRR